MRTIGVLTTSRADYGICLPVLRAVHSDPELQLRLFVSGSHLSPEFGYSVKEIARDPWPIAEKVEVLLSTDSPEGMAKSMGLALIGFAQVFSANRPDLLLVVGDRFEVHAAVSATVPFQIPVAHIHGGEITNGAIDEVFRHSITKLSHLHFTATETYARRVAQLGEEPWRIFVSGAPGLDNLLSLEIPSAQQLGERWGIDWAMPTLLVTYHPVTRIAHPAHHEVLPLLQAIASLDLQAIFTFPNADTGGRTIIAEILEFQKSHPKTIVVTNASQEGYLGLMKYCSAMAGNSSSGIIEAASFGLPVVNIGPRQAGRLRAANVIDVDNDDHQILSALRRALSPGFRDSLEGLQNPYGDGRAASRITDVLKTISIDEHLVAKRFADFPQAGFAATPGSLGSAR